MIDLNNNNYRYTIKGKCTLVETNEGNYILKEKTDNINIKGLFSYLKSRDFYTFADVVDDSRREVNIYEFVEDCVMPKEQRSEDLINTAIELHSKTLYFKEVREDKYKEIYENILSNINYLENYYDTLFMRFLKEKYPAPSHYLFMQNFYKIMGAISFCREETDNWYELVKNEKNMRVCIIHNDLSIDHYLKSNKDALISWDKHRVDTPVLDLVKLYQNDNLKYDFKFIFDKYDERFGLNVHEKKLFFILIIIPKKIEFNDTEFKNTIMLRHTLDSLFKTEELIKPYYSENEEK